MLVGDVVKGLKEGTLTGDDKTAALKGLLTGHIEKRDPPAKTVNEEFIKESAELIPLKAIFEGPASVCGKRLPPFDEE